MMEHGIEVRVVRAAQPRGPEKPVSAGSRPRWNLDRIGHIDHRKVLVIDGRIGWVGGAGIEDHFADGRFHDLFLRVTGPVVSQLQLLLFSGVAFFVMLRWLRRTLTITLDFDWLYRVLFRKLALLAGRAIDRINVGAARLARQACARLDAAGRLWLGPHGMFARTWPSGTMALGMMAMLLAFLLSFYLS